jgi:hypothetical protein
MTARNLVALALVVATGCTHDFSLFQVGHDVPAGGDGGSDASSASGGAAASGGGGDAGALASGGLPASGGGSAGQTTGGSGGTLASGGSGGLATGGTSASGGAGGASGAGGGALDSGLPTCNTIYGAVPGYLRCDETRTTCRFLQVSAAAESCTTICAAHGGTCSGADNGDPGSCALTGTATCATLFASSICLCSRQ